MLSKAFLHEGKDGVTRLFIFVRGAGEKVVELGYECYDRREHVYTPGEDAIEMDENFVEEEPFFVSWHREGELEEAAGRDLVEEWQRWAEGLDRDYCHCFSLRLAYKPEVFEASVSLLVAGDWDSNDVGVFVEEFWDFEGGELVRCYASTVVKWRMEEGGWRRIKIEKKEMEGGDIAFVMEERVKEKLYDRLFWGLGNALLEDGQKSNRRARRRSDIVSDAHSILGLVCYYDTLRYVRNAKQNNQRKAP